MGSATEGGARTEGRQRGDGFLPTSSPVLAQSVSLTTMGHPGSVGPRRSLRGARQLPGLRTCLVSVSSKTRGKASPPVQRSRHARARSPPHGGRPQRRPRSMPAARRGKLRSRRIVCRRCHPNMLLPRRPGAATTRLPAGSCLRFGVPPWRTPPCKLWEMRRSPTGRHRCPQVGRPRAETSLPSARLPSSPTSSRHGRSGRRRRRPSGPVSRRCRADGRLSLSEPMGHSWRRRRCPGRPRCRRRCPRRNDRHPRRPRARRLHGAR